MRLRILPLTIVLMIFAACSSEKPAPATETAKPATTPPPSPQQARDLLANSQELSEHAFTDAGWTAPMTRASMSEPLRAEAKQLEDAGWVAFDGSGNLVLTEKSQADKRFLLRANGIIDIIPLAKKELGQVTAVRPNPDGTVAADFTWKWLPNEVGSAFKSGMIHDRYAAEQKSTAELMWNGSGWVVIRIK